MRIELYSSFIIQDAIHRIKDTFNKTFTDIYKQREQEIARIGEKNQRISKILEDLSSGEKMWQPEMDSSEKPEKLLTVEDNEVYVLNINLCMCLLKSWFWKDSWAPRFIIVSSNWNSRGINVIFQGQL